MSLADDEHVPSTKSMWDFGGREIGRMVADAPGPTLIVIAGIHGNERAGTRAARRMLSLLERRKGAMRGEFVAIAGNLGAMRANVRYRLRDLNRVWSPERLSELEAKVARSEPLDAEEEEQHELFHAIRAAVARARGPVYLIDCHTTSAHGVPFVLFGDTLSQRRFASALPLPILIGLEEQLDGVLSAYWTAQGVVTCSVEGGQHDDPGSIDNLEAVLIVGAESAGLFGSGILTEVQAAYTLLERRRGDLPRICEVVGRHAITEEDGFVMEPGYLNLARVRAGEKIAHDRRGPIHAPKDGMIILPLYQGQGTDGYFWGREVSAMRLYLSDTLRSLKLDRLLHLLPGVARDPKKPSKLVVDDEAHGKLHPDMFHLLGYRRVRKGNGHVIIERQEHSG